MLTKCLSAVALSACLFALPAKASDITFAPLPAPQKVVDYKSGGVTVPVDVLGDITSTITDNDAFAVAVQPVLVGLTQKLNAEVCATFARNAEGHLAARITTIYARASCLITDAVPEGYTDDLTDIHTHVEVKKYRPTKIDRVFLLQNYGPSDYVRTNAYDFSEGDYQRPRAYLVQSQSVLYAENGKKTRRIVKQFSK